MLKLSLSPYFTTSFFKTFGCLCLSPHQKQNNAIQSKNEHFPYLLIYTLKLFPKRTLLNRSKCPQFPRLQSGLIPDRGTKHIKSVGSRTDIKN